MSGPTRNEVYYIGEISKLNRKIFELHGQLSAERNRVALVAQRKSEVDSQIASANSAIENEVVQLKKKINAEKEEHQLIVRDLKREISRLKMKRSSEVNSSEEHQKLLSELTSTSAMTQLLKNEITAQKLAAEDGRQEVLRHLQYMINKACLTPARREYYLRFLENFDIGGLMALLENMKFLEEKE